MQENKFFEKFLENLSKIDEYNLKNIIELLEKERRTFKRILDSLDEGLAVIDEKKFVFINSKMQEMLRMKNIKLPFGLEKAKSVFQNKELSDFIFSLPQEHIHTEFVTKETRPDFYEVEKITFPDKFCIIKITNITAKKELEFQIKNLESIAALNTLAAGIAHEIKNPMTAIDLHTQVLRKAIKNDMLKVPDEIKKYIEIIQDETRRLNNILNDFLISARKREMKISFEDINEYLESLLDFLLPLLEENNITLIKDFHSLPKIFIDKDYLKQAIINLIKNAVEAMKESEKRELQVSTFYEVGKDAVSISIKDSGTGIEEERLSKVFEPYYTTRQQGTGLGLTIVYKIVKEHGGDIMVFTNTKKNASKDNPEGTTFTILLPIGKGTRLITNKNNDKEK